MGNIVGLLLIDLQSNTCFISNKCVTKLKRGPKMKQIDLYLYDWPRSSHIRRQ